MTLPSPGHFRRLLVLPLLALCVAPFSEAASTDPLGFYAVKIAGRAENGPPARTYFGLQLLPALKFAGQAVAVNGHRMSFNNPAGAVADPDRTLYLHVTDGTGQGFISDITGFDGNDVICADNLAPWITPGVMVKIRPHPHISDIFGADNRFGLGSGPDAANADNVVIWDPEAQQEQVYYFHSVRSRWEKRGVEADAGKARLSYPYGLYIVRRAEGGKRISLSGEIGYEPVLLPVRQGANVFSLPVNLSASLDSLISSTGPHSVEKGRNASRADLLTFEEPSSGITRGPFYYRSSSFDSGWREVGIDDGGAALQPLDLLSTLTLRRREAATGYVLARGSLEPVPGGVPPIDPAPEPGEPPLTVTFPMPPTHPPDGVIWQLETSIDLQTWTPMVHLERSPGGIVFNLPAGASRAFYRITILGFE